MNLAVFCFRFFSTFLNARARAGNVGACVRTSSRQTHLPARILSRSPRLEKRLVPACPVTPFYPCSQQSQIVPAPRATAAAHRLRFCFFVFLFSSRFLRAVGGSKPGQRLGGGVRVMRSSGAIGGGAIRAARCTCATVMCCRDGEAARRSGPAPSDVPVTL